MPLAKQGTEEPQFSGAELKVQALANRRANAQLLRVPWPRFRRAYEEYPRWQSLALWTRAVIARQGHVPSVLLATLQAHCPRFLESEPGCREPELLAFHLLDWVHSQRLAYAKRQGWLDALTFYGVRHPRSEAAWAFWEHCDNEGSKTPPEALRSFEEWEQIVSKMRIRGEASYVEVASAVARYIDWEAAALWLRPLVVSHLKLPTHVVSELERRFSSLLGRTRFGSDQRIKGECADWRSLIRICRKRCLSDAKAMGCPDDFIHRVRSHPRYVRFMAYSNRWGAEWSRKGRQHYPSFRQWRLAADQYSEANPNRSRANHAS